MPGGQRLYFRLDAEQAGEEVLQVRREGDEQLGLLFRGELPGRLPRGEEPGLQGRIGLGEESEKGGVQRAQRLAVVEAGEALAEAQIQRRGVLGSGAHEI